jgi:hypothetical protein
MHNARTLCYMQPSLIGVVPMPAVTAGRTLLIALLLLAATYGAVLVRATPPAPLPVDAPPQLFSAARALARLRGLVGNDKPHPVGSVDDDRIRPQLLDALGQLGLQPQVQEKWSCGEYGDCATVRNVVARIDGREPGRAVLVIAHYDSVIAGPGAADDGASVASILELARAIRAGPQLRHSVILLLDEGEEAGLLGTQAFLAGHPWRGDVGAIVNLEARGTSGASRMFETSGHNAWLVDALAKGLPRPVTSSLFPAVYERLPNNTDLTLAKMQGIPGVNFAFIGGAARYHTPLDNVANLDPRSLQHQGENALGTVRALAETALTTPPPGEVVFFDVLSLTIVSWPRPWTVPLAVAALLLVLACGVMQRGRRFRAVIVQAIRLVVYLGLAVAAGYFLIGVLTGVGAVSGAWIARPGPVLAACWCLGLGLAALNVWMQPRAQAETSWLGVWLLWSVVGLALAITLPGASYLFVAPSLIAGLFGVLWLPTRGRPPTVLPAIAMGLVWFPVVQSLYDALGTPVLAGLVGIVVLLGATVTPLVAALDARGQGRCVGLALTATLLFFGWASVTPAHSPTTPARMSITLAQQGDSDPMRWAVLCDDEALPQSLQQAAAFARQPERVPPWARDRRFVAPAPVARLPLPEVQVLENTVTGERRHVRLRATSKRGASLFNFTFPPGSGVEAMTMQGLPVHLVRRAALKTPEPWSVYTAWTVPPTGIELDLTLTGPGRMDVMDETFGLPPEAAALVQARPAWGVPIHHGDTVSVTRTMQF